MNQTSVSQYQKSSRVVTTPDGVTRILTLANWYWSNFDALTFRHGISAQGFATKWWEIVKHYKDPHEALHYHLEQFILQAVKLDEWGHGTVRAAFGRAAQRSVVMLKTVG